jgi:hypothetical protein
MKLYATEPNLPEPAAELASLETFIRKDVAYAEQADLADFAKQIQARNPRISSAQITLAYLQHLRQLAWLLRAEEILALEMALAPHDFSNARNIITQDLTGPIPAPGDPLHENDPDAIYLAFLRKLHQRKLMRESASGQLVNA